MKTRHTNIMIQNMMCCFGCMCMHISMEILRAIIELHLRYLLDRNNYHMIFVLVY